MKKNGHLRRFLALFLALVMIMADSSVTTFAGTVGMVKQKSAAERSLPTQVEVTVNAPDGTYYLSAMQSNESNDATSKVAKVEVVGGTGTVELVPKQSDWDISANPIVLLSLKNGTYTEGESYDQNKYNIIRNGEIFRTENGNVCSVTIASQTVTLTSVAINPGTSRNFRSILGSSTNYGIVANEATFKGHLESNFAIGKLNFEGSNVQMAKNDKGGAGYNYIGEFVGSNTLIIDLNGNAGGSVVYAGKGVQGKLSTNDGGLLIFDYDTYTESQIKKIVKDMVDEINTTSKNLYNESSVAYDLVTDKDNACTNINIAKYGAAAGTYYVQFQPGEFNTFITSNNRTITIREDQNIVLNIPDTVVDFYQFKLKIVDTVGNVVYEKTTNANADEDRVAQNVVFNCPNATTAATHTATGIFLVPNATFTNAVVSAGWVIANRIAAIGGQEWHNVFHGMPVVDTTFQIRATKNVDGEAAIADKYNGKFHFELLKKNGNNWDSLKTVTNNKETVLFDNLGKFETEGQHYYKIVETQSDLSDVVKDNKTIYVKAVVKKIENKLVAAVTYYEDENYSKQITDPSFNNTSISEKTEVKVTKDWVDNNNQDGLRPNEIKVQLYADGTAKGEAVVLNEGNNWTYTWADLDVKKAGQEIAYTVEEVGKVSGYTTVVSGDAETGFTITNTHTPETTKVEGTKTWNDAENQDGKRPTSITVRLLADGKETASQTVTEADGWKYSFTDLPKYKDGKAIVYTVTEDNVPDYTTSITGYNITNSYTPGKTSISVTKVWEDNNNQDGKRAKEIRVQLYADGTAKGEAVVLNEGNKWTYTWDGLDAKKKGKDITYTVEEAGEVSGYTTVVTGDAETGFTITNTHTPETTKVEGTKTWNDAENQDGKRPTSITVRLLADGKETASQTVTEADGWKYSFTDLPKYKDGQAIIYTVTEDSVPDYTTSITGYNITNSYTPGKTSISVTKVWEDNNNQDGKRAKEIRVQLYADGTAKGEAVVLNEGNKWTYTWDGLDAKKKGKDITYTVEEAGEVSGYTTVVTGDAETGFTITNTHTPETTKVEGTKTWNDAENQDGKRPTSITVRLLADGKETASQTVTEADGWKYSFTDLPKYKDGKAIVYTVTEDSVPDYTTSITGYNITNSYTPGKTSISVTKAWEDNNNQDGKRAKEIRVQLYADGTAKGEAVVLNEGNKWTYTWSDLDVKKAGQEIAYTVEEAGEVSGYTTVVSGDAETGFTITNTHTPETTKVEGSKTWDDAENQDGKRPTSITVRLLADGKETASQTVTEADGWKYSFTDLPKYKDGKAIVYTVTEDSVPDYTTSITGYNITNSYTPGKTSISVTKAWEDNNNQDGKRAKEIRVQLYADGTAKGEAVVLNEGNKWTYTWSDLDVKKKGKDITYTVEEAGEVSGYTTVVTGDAETGFTITNTHTPETTKVEGTKTWNDAENQDGKRPTSITVRLLADGKETASQTVTEADGWKYSFTDLPKYKDGKAIVYTVTEDSVPDYTTSITGYNITNSYTPGKTSISVTKAWEDNNNQDGKRAKEIRVQLYADGTAKGEAVVLNEGNKWTYTWSDLDVKKKGKDITYTVEEAGEVSGYTTVVTGDAETGFTITNTHTPETTKVEGTKTWNDAENQDGKRPTSITVRLLADGKETASQTVTEADGWKYSFTDLPKYKDGKAIVYTVTEDSVPDYTTSITGYNITNSYTPGKTSISVTKAWEDNNNQDGKRAKEIRVQLYADGTAKGEAVVLNEGNKWTYTWDGLDAKKKGKDITYTVEEAGEVSGYTTVVTGDAETGFTITNTHTPETTKVEGTKTWNDAENQDGKRPTSITVRLLADGKETASQTVTEADGWKYSFTDLPKYKDGKAIIYTVTEDSVPDYTTSITGYNITNSYTPGKTSISVTKVWEDNNNQDGKRAKEIRVQLYADGTAKGEAVVLNEGNKWTYTWDGLDAKKKGKDITYTVEEAGEVSGYTTVVTGDAETGFTITNTHTPETTKVEGTKTWNDAENQDGKRPTSITVRLLADGKETASQTVTEADGWKYSFTDLPKYKDGKAIVYTVTEDSVPDYTTSITGYNIANSYTPGKTSISVTKAWEDNNNQDGKRAKEIRVQLYADGTAKGEAVVLNEGNKWTYTWDGLDVKKAGQEIAYTVEEVGKVSGYTTVVSGTAKDGFQITNSHTPEKIDITGSKTWNDSNDQDRKRPEKITVNLLANGSITDTKTVTAKDNWTYSFTDLPKYANGQEIIYTVSENPVSEYTTTYNGYDITNSYTPGKTSATVTKVWADANNQDGTRPESITVALLADGKATDTTVTLNAANNWTQTVTGLPEKADGEYITYTWTEGDVPEGYSLTGTSKTGIVTTLTNTHTPELTSVSGTKTWNDNNDQDGKRPTSIIVNLLANGTLSKSQTVSADASGNWTYSFTELPKYANGKEIVYTVTENAVEGYTTELDGNNIINTYKPETTKIAGTKTWKDADDQDGKRPESINIILLANGAEKDRKMVTADEAGKWSYSFTDLPKYADGKEITYTVSEEEVADYTTTYDGNNIINSYTPGKTSATVTKIWDDAENQDGKRPESITVALLADGKATGITVTLNAENNWTQTVSDLQEKANGKAIDYTWTEENVPEGYELTGNSKNGTVTTLTNTLAPEKITITGTKTWKDGENQDGKRPESITVNLFANGEKTAEQIVKADGAGNWTYSFTNLPKYAKGEEITYTVTENEVEGYETSVDGFDITNAYTPETTEVKGTKTWNDADNQDGKRPESITVRLHANGEEKDSQTVKADENGNWTYSFENLPKYEAGKEIVYTVTEDAVTDYTTEITGYDITNSYAPGKTSVTVTKAWDDNNDRDGHRPDEIRVQLKADGENSGEEVVLNAKNNWTYTWSELDQKKAGKDIAYAVEETSKAKGYITTVTGNAVEGFVITNKITSVKISKVDITDQKELAGAHIQIIDKEGNVVEEWDSTWESHEVTGLKTGEKYTLRETVAPEGYAVTSDTSFILKEDGTVDKDNTSTTINDDGTLLVEDSRTFVKVSKVDIADGKELEGAHIQIIDQDGNIVEEWDSTKEAHVIEKLKTGKVYTLRETVAPDGYLLTSDTTFVLKEDGTVDTEKTTTVSKDGVLLVQDSLATSASIAVTKKLTYIGDGLVARSQTFYVALYEDEACTKKVSDVKALEFKNADSSTVVFSENIEAGKKYYIAECTKEGVAQKMGVLADGTTYEAVFADGNSTTVTEENGTTTVYFENVFSSFPPDGFYRQGQLTITKRLLGADGDTKNSDKVFYAGIFDDAEHTQLSSQVEQNLITLDMSGGYEVSETINVGLAQSGAKVTLYIAETDANGKPVAGAEDFGYKVTVSADSVTIDEENTKAEVIITNTEEPTVTVTPTPTPSSSEEGGGGSSENHSGGYGSKSPKTGDDAPIGTYVMLLLAAAMLAVETERRRRRNKR